METVDRKQFIFSKGPNGAGTFYTFLNNNIDEIGFEHVSVNGDVKDLYVLIRERYSNEGKLKFYTLDQFIKEFANTGAKIILTPGWDVDLALCIKNLRGEFVALSDNVHLNFPGMGGNAPHKIDYSKIKEFDIRITYSTYRVNVLM